MGLRWAVVAAVAGCGGLRGISESETGAGASGPTLVGDSAGSDTSDTDTGSDGSDPVDDTAVFDYDALVGRTYALDLAAAEWVEPVGLGALIEAEIEQALLAAVVTSSAEELAIIGAVSIPGVEPPVQDPCTSSVAFPSAGFATAPAFSLGPKDVLVPVSGLFIVFGDLLLTGRFADDLGAIEGASVSAVVDTRPLVDAIDPGGAESSLCDLADALGGGCEPCPDGSGSFCLPVQVDGIAAPEVSATLVEVEQPCTAPECQGHGECT